MAGTLSRRARKKNGFPAETGVIFLMGEGRSGAGRFGLRPYVGRGRGGFPLPAEKIFFSKAAGSEGGGTRAFCGSAGERTGAERSFQNVYKAEPFTLYRTHEKVGKT